MIHRTILETGEIVEKPFTETEVNEIKDAEIRNAAELKLEAKKQADKLAAEYKLAALGLTADDLTALGL